MTTLIGAHSDVFVAVLKEQQAHVSMAMLQELALVTAVISHSNVGKILRTQYRQYTPALYMYVKSLGGTSLIASDVI